jgi:glycosyltransferase involved in cell wall biosynthesis
MRIAIVSPYISTTDDLEYYQSQQLNLASELAGLGEEVDVITSKRSPRQPDLEVLDPGVRVVRLSPLWGRLEGLLKQPLMKGLWRQLRRGDYDVVQSSEDFSISTLVSALYALRRRRRLVVYQGVYFRSRNRLAGWLMAASDLFAGFLVRRACSVAACKTSAARRYLQDKGFRRADVIPVGVKKSAFFQTGGAAGCGSELLTVGNLIPLKNFELLLDVFRTLSSLRPGARLTIVGTGPERERIASYVERHGLEDKVVLAGRVPNDKMRKYYSKADLFVLLSRVEIFGMVMLEAMACGCPVMSTPTPGAVDIIRDGKNGFIVEGEDPGPIARRIEAILADRERLNDVAGEALRTAERHSWPAIARRYHALYRGHAGVVKCSFPDEDLSIRSENDENDGKKSRCYKVDAY